MTMNRIYNTSSLQGKQYFPGKSLCIHIQELLIPNFS